MSDEQKPKKKAAASTSPVNEKPVKPEELPPLTAEELKGFVPSEGLQDILDQCDEEIKTLKDRRQQAIDNANRQVAAFDGAIEQQSIFKNKQLTRAQRKFVDGKKQAEKAAKPTEVKPAKPAEPAPRTRSRMPGGTGAT